jgi:hypothetical protein
MLLMSPWALVRLQAGPFLQIDESGFHRSDSRAGKQDASQAMGWRGRYRTHPDLQVVMKAWWRMIGDREIDDSS